MTGSFTENFVRQPVGMRDHPALVLNADFRPLSYMPLSVWPWWKYGFRRWWFL